MKAGMVILGIFILSLALIPAAAADKPQSGAGVPKYNPATEVTVKGSVEEVRDRTCPVSRGMGSHVILKTADDKTIEVHLAPTKFVKTYELVFAKGDQL